MLSSAFSDGRVGWLGCSASQSGARLILATGPEDAWPRLFQVGLQWHLSLPEAGRKGTNRAISWGMLPQDWFGLTHFSPSLFGQSATVMHAYACVWDQIVRRTCT